jgi:hypothetical protein
LPPSCAARSRRRRWRQLGQQPCKPACGTTEVDAGAHDQPNHVPVHRRFAHRTMRQALPGADARNFAIPADRPAKGRLRNHRCRSGSRTAGERNGRQEDESGSTQVCPRLRVPAGRAQDRTLRSNPGAPIETAEPVRGCRRGDRDHA